MEKVKPIAEKWAATGVICLEKMWHGPNLLGNWPRPRQWQGNIDSEVTRKRLINTLRTNSFFIESSYFVPLTKMASTLRIHLVDHAQRWQLVLPRCCHNKSTHSTTHRRRKFNSLWRGRTTLLLGEQSQSNPIIFWTDRESCFEDLLEENSGKQPYLLYIYCIYLLVKRW